MGRGGKGRRGGGAEFDFGDAGEGELMVKGNFWLRVDSG